MQKNGLAKKLYKFHGYVSNTIADDIVADGNSYMDGQLGIGLFHGKYSHLFQDVLLICGMQDKKINSEFNNDFIAPHEIMAGIIKYQCWTTVRDTRINDKVSFIDPHRINSIIMTQGENLKLPVLQAYSVDNFCMAAPKLLKLYNNKTTPYGRPPTGLSEFFGIMKFYDLRTFFTIDGAEWTQLNRETSKKSYIHANYNTFVVAEPKYKVNKDFIVKRYPEYLNSQAATIQSITRSLQFFYFSDKPTHMPKHESSLNLNDSDRMQENTASKSIDSPSKKAFETKLAAPPSKRIKLIEKNQYSDIPDNEIYLPWQVHKPGANLDHLIKEVVGRIAKDSSKQWMLVPIIGAISEEKGKERYKNMADEMLKLANQEEHTDQSIQKLKF